MFTRASGCVSECVCVGNMWCDVFVFFVVGLFVFICM